MSGFSQSVRAELCTSAGDKDRGFACLCAMLLFSKREGGYPGFSSSSTAVFGFFLNLIEMVFKGRISPEITGEKSCIIRDEKQLRLAMDKLPFLGSPESFSFAQLGKIRQDAFFAGIFLACGGVSNPEKEYHLEFFPPSVHLCRELYTVLRAKGIPVKTRESGTVYIKDSEGIEDVLALMGAGMSALQVMNAKIRKDIANLANRRTNCDTANIEKTLVAAEKQLAAIYKIRDRGEFDSLPPPLRELAQLRMDNPQATLSELGEMLSSPIGRAGVNRRMQKLKEIADNTI